MMMSHGAAGVGALSSSSPSSSSRRATRVVNLRDIHRLIEECHESLQNNPTCLHTRAIRGHACMKAKMWSLAIQDFTAILQQRPEDIHCRFSRGMALFKSKRIEEAQTDFSTVLAINPHHVMARYARAGCFNTEGEFHRAIQDYTIALQDDEQKTESGCFHTSPASNNRLRRDLHQQPAQSDAHTTRAREFCAVDPSSSLVDQPVRRTQTELPTAPTTGLAIPERPVPPPLVIPRAQETSSIAATIPRDVRGASKTARRVVQVTVNLTDFAPAVPCLQPEPQRTEAFAAPASYLCPVAMVNDPKPTRAPPAPSQSQSQPVRPITTATASRMVRKVTVAL